MTLMARSVVRDVSMSRTAAENAKLPTGKCTRRSVNVSRNNLVTLTLNILAQDAIVNQKCGTSPMMHLLSRHILLG